MAAIPTGLSRTLTPRSIASSLSPNCKTTAAGGITLAKLTLPYLWAAKSGKHWYYRRNGQFIPLKLKPGDAGFLEAYNHVSRSFGEPKPGEESVRGTIGHLTEEYRASPEFAQLSDRARRDYRYYLDILREAHGHRPIATMPRGAVRKLRDEYQATPSKANYLIKVLRLILSYAADDPQKFRLPPNWLNPASRPKRLRTGDGH